MASNVVTVPNLLTLLRMILIPIFAIALFYGHSEIALAIFVVAGLTDMLDGMIARRFNQESSLGTIIDPIADKLLMTTAFIILTLPNIVPPTRHLPVPFWVTASVIGRDVLILSVAGAINIMTGFRGFRPSQLGKISTFVQVAGVTIILLATVFGNTYFLPTVYTTVVALAFFSGVHYIFHVARLMREEDKIQSNDIK